MKKGLAAALLVLLILAASLAVAGAASAPEGAIPIDVGNFNDYDSGGDWDSGSSWDDSGWDSSYDSGSSGVFFLIGDSSIALIVVVVVAIILFAVFGKKKGSGNRQQGGPQQVQDNTSVIYAAISAVDPNFSTEKFLGWAKEVFITLQQAWMERNWSKVRPFEKEELFQQHQAQLDEYVRLGRINVIERININQAFLQKYRRDAEYEYLTVYLQVRMVDYIKDENTGKVLKGDPAKDCYLQYLYTFMRKFGVKTDPANSNQSTVACPHCGAPVQITSAGQCEYCGFIVTTGEYDWVLSDITGVRPGMRIDNSGVDIAGGDGQQ